MSEIVNLSKDHLIGIVGALQTRTQKIREQNTRSAKKYRAQHRNVVRSEVTAHHLKLWVRVVRLGRKGV